MAMPAAWSVKVKMLLLSDDQVLQREPEGTGSALIEFFGRGDPTAFSLKVTSAGVTVPGVRLSPSSLAEGNVIEAAGLPTGGPYSIELTDHEGHRVASIERVLVGDLWLLAGQSNMQGIGELAERLPSLERAAMLSFDRRWKPALEPLHRFWETKDSAQYKMSPFLGFDINADGLEKMFDELHPQDLIEPIGGVGPGCFFADQLIQLCGVPVGLIPCALSGSPLDMWQRDFHQRDGLPFEDTLFGNLVDRVTLAGGRIAGMLWYQGESDAMPGASETYLDRFKTFVSDLRADLNQLDLPVITVQLASADNVDNWTNEAIWDRMREAQRQAADSLSNVLLVASADLPRNDHVHISGKGQRVLGERLAMAASGFVDECNCEITTPRLGRVCCTEGGIEVTFEGVNGSLRATGDLKEAFTVTGAQVIGAVINSGNTVSLSLAEQCQPGVQIYYGSGFQPGSLLADEAGFVMPSFGPVAAIAPS